MLLLLLLRLFLLSVGCCLPGKRDGIQSEREAERERERSWSVLCFILAALLCHREVDLGTGYRSADPWITSSE